MVCVAVVGGLLGVFEQKSIKAPNNTTQMCETTISETNKQEEDGNR